MSRGASRPRHLIALSILVGFLACGEMETYQSESSSGLQQERLVSMADPAVLLDVLIDPDSARIAEALSTIDRINFSDSLHPDWPLFTYLSAEVYRISGDSVKARDMFRSLVSWSMSDPYGDGWGGSGLAAVALWRWSALLALCPDPDSTSILSAAHAARELLRLRLNRRMFETSLLTTMPQLRPQILSNMASLTWRIGHRESAFRFFLDYLKFATRDSLEPVQDTILRDVIDSGLVDTDRILLLRGKRLLRNKNFRGAQRILEKAAKSENIQVRAEAMLHLSKARLATGVCKSTVISLLSSAYRDLTDPELAQEALFSLAIRQYREGPGRDVEGSLKNHLQLLSEFPNGSRADDALYQMAKHFEDSGDLDSSLHYYDVLSRFGIEEGNNDWLNSSRFRPAMLLYVNHTDSSLAESARLLSELLEQIPDGPFRQASRFWLGRIAEDRGQRDQARAWFKEVAEEVPFDYYGIRSKMHLEKGADASRSLWPDSTTTDYLKLRSGRPIDTLIQLRDIYYTRLEHSAESGLYARCLNVVSEMAESLRGRRVEALSLSDLDSSNFLSHHAILLSLRQDAFAFADKCANPSEQTQVAQLVGYHASDWQLAMSISTSDYLPYEASLRQRWSLQFDGKYLETAYPRLYIDSIFKYSREYEVDPALIYAIIRRASSFYPFAVSSGGALGLFQFSKPTFGRLDTTWQLLETSGLKYRSQYLMDPWRSLELGAKWFGDSLLPNQDGNVLFAIMEHVAGKDAVDSWKRNWGDLKDVELIVESIRTEQARGFTREVLCDMAIARAIIDFKTGDIADGKSR